MGFYLLLFLVYQLYVFSGFPPQPVLALTAALLQFSLQLLGLLLLAQQRLFIVQDLLVQLVDCLDLLDLGFHESVGFTLILRQ